MFKENFIRICNLRGVSPSRCVKDAGLGSSAYSQWTETTVPHDATLMKLAERLDCTVEDLLSDDSIVSEKRKGTRPIIGLASAGKGCYAEEDILGYEKVDSEYDKDEYYWIRVVGSSMSPKIEDGDLVLIQSADSVDNGDIAVVLVDGTDGLLKKVVFDADSVQLVSYNTLYAPMVFKQSDIERVRIQGKAVQLKRSL